MNDKHKPFASPPCTMHEVDDQPPAGDDDSIAGWRRSERRRLRALCRALPAASRQRADAAIAANLDGLVAEHRPACVAVYWPLPVEPDLAPWFASVAGRGTQLALPRVTARDRPLEFGSWRPGDVLEPDVLGIPAPVRAAAAQPDFVVAPLVGYDRERYRLGNGGGFYDRTFAATARPLLVAAGYAACELRTIYPQAHDIRMDYIVTDAGILGARS